MDLLQAGLTLKIGRKMKSLKEYIDAVLDEENTQGDEGTPKLTKHRMKMTPGQPVHDVSKPKKDESNTFTTSNK